MSLRPKKVNFDETWADLRETVGGVITLAKVPRSIWNDRFSDVYSLCVAYPEPLADRLYFETRKFLHNHVKELLDDVRSRGEEQLLKNYHKQWIQYSLGIDYLHRLYQYLNQQHIKKQKLSEAEVIYGNLVTDFQEQMEIGELGLSIWRTCMISPLRETLVKLLLDGIHQDRIGDGDVNITNLIHDVLLSFVVVQEFKKNSLELYQEIFETPFIAASGEHYKMEARRILEQQDVSGYIAGVTKILEEESYRSRKYLHHSSVPKVKACCEQHMVANHLAFLHEECKEMVQQERTKDLANIYPLLRAVPGGIHVLINEVLEHIKYQGLDALRHLKGDNIHIQFVEKMLAVHTKYKNLIQEVFQGDQSFVGALDKACAFVINNRPSPKQPCRSSEMLSKYCDSLLKKSSKGMAEGEVDEKLAECITIFKYIDDKDVFHRFYSRMLAKRLIHQQSQAMDAEEAMINRLKTACGYEFTNKLHRMFTDISLSSDLNNKFAEFLKEEQVDLGISFSINVLQAGAWPLGPTVVTNFALPQELEKSVQMFKSFYEKLFCRPDLLPHMHNHNPRTLKLFENFYHNHFSGRKLTWLHHLCQGELKLGYLKKQYQITMQTFQIAIMLLFEKIDSISCKEVQETLQLNTEQFTKHVQGLIEAKLLIVNTEEPVVPQTMLYLNLDFTNKRTKFKISAALQRESPQEVEQTMSAVDEDRKMYLHATIVRIMKSRKLLRHNTLIQEVLSQSKMTFTPSVSMIKKCIESLIDKQYIERTPNSADEYSYVA